MTASASLTASLHRSADLSKFRYITNDPSTVIDRFHKFCITHHEVGTFNIHSRYRSEGALLLTRASDPPKVVNWHIGQAIGTTPFTLYITPLAAMGNETPQKN
jgi:hypothetical protein